MPRPPRLDAKDFAVTTIHLSRALVIGIRLLGNLAYLAIFVLVWPGITNSAPISKRPVVHLIGLPL
jgi:hypothetical protein